MSDAGLARQYVAAMNLACAVGLPGAEEIDASGCLAALDHWPGLVGRSTETAVESQFRPNPAEFDHSEAVPLLVDRGQAAVPGEP